MTRSDLLVINKTDLAPLVGADLDVMARDAAAQRGDLPTLFLSLVGDRGARRSRTGSWPSSTTGERARRVIRL